MKIVNKEVESIRFEQLKPGDVFVPASRESRKPNYGLTYIKLEGSAGNDCNAVDLSDGRQGSFQKDAQVYPVNYELHIVV